MRFPLLNVYVKKPEYPVLCTGMNGQWEFGSVSPQAYEAFSKEEAPPCGRGSSLNQVFFLPLFLTSVMVTTKI